jgi:ATP-dependent DNA helicase RecG
VVSLYPDRLEVTSPGGFPPGVTPENALRHPPVHRNELLARAFQTIGIVNRVGLGIDRIYEDLLRSGKGLPRYTTDETHVRLVIPFAVSAGFALFVGQEERKGRRLELDDLLLLRGLAEKGSLDRWSAGAVLQLSPEEAAARLVRMREMGYAVTRGRGRGSAYALAPLLGERIGPVGAATEDGFPADEQGRRRRALSALGKQGRLTNADVRALLGLTRPKAARFLKSLVDEGQARYEGAGRGACVVSSSARRKGGRGQGRAEVAAKVESCRPGPMRPEGGL